MSHSFGARVRAQLQISEGRKAQGDYYAETDEPDLRVDQRHIDRQQQEAKSDGEIPPGVKPGIMLSW